MELSHKLVLCLLAYVSGLAVGLSLNYKFNLGSQDEYEIILKLQSAISLVLLPVGEINLQCLHADTLLE